MKSILKSIFFAVFVVLISVVSGEWIGQVQNHQARAAKALRRHIISGVCFVFDYYMSNN